MAVSKLEMYLFGELTVMESFMQWALASKKQSNLYVSAISWQLHTSVHHIKLILSLTVNRQIIRTKRLSIILLLFYINRWEKARKWELQLILKIRVLCFFLTCCAAKRQQVWAPHRKLLTKVHVGLKGHWGYEKNWEWWAASPTRRARAGLQSCKIGPFWEAVAIFPLFLWGRNLWPHISTYLAYWIQLKNL